MSSPDPSSSSEPTFEIVSSRIFAARRTTVFQAFRDPQHLAQWWGPKGFTNTIHEFDLRKGGTWRMTMHGPDGANFENEKTFTEVIAPERVVFDHHGPMHAFRMSLTFGDLDEKTLMTWRMQFPDTPENAKLRSFIAQANEENFDRLEAYLPKLRAEA